MTLAVETEPTFKKQGSPRKLFECRSYSNPTSAMYDIHPDGDRFLIVRLEEESATVKQINLVSNFFEELKRKVPTGS